MNELLYTYAKRFVARLPDIDEDSIERKNKATLVIDCKSSFNRTSLYKQNGRWHGLHAFTEIAEEAERMGITISTHTENGHHYIKLNLS